MTVVPILLVVGWVYGYMWLRGTHDQRYHRDDRRHRRRCRNRLLDSLHCAASVRSSRTNRVDSPRSDAPEKEREERWFYRRSPRSSVFGVMALAPTPLFASFGELMAVMVIFSAVCGAARSAELADRRHPAPQGRRNAKELEAAITEGEFEYETALPADTALRRPGPDMPTDENSPAGVGKPRDADSADVGTREVVGFSHDLWSCASVAGVHEDTPALLEVSRFRQVLRECAPDSASAYRVTVDAAGDVSVDNGTCAQPTLLNTRWLMVRSARFRTPPPSPFSAPATQTIHSIGNRVTRPGKPR